MVTVCSEGAAIDTFGRINSYLFEKLSLFERIHIPRNYSMDKSMRQ